VQVPKSQDRVSEDFADRQPQEVFPCDSGKRFLQSRFRPNREDGVVLIALLWLLVALSLLAMNLASEVRTEASLARSSGDSEKAYFLARGALEQVIYRLSFPDKEEEKQKSVFPFSDGMNHFWLKDGAMVCHVAILDEGGKLDLNHASEKILRKLLNTLGIEDARSKALARNIVQWRESDKSPGSRWPDDRATQVIHQKFTSIEELLLVSEMTREVLYGGLKKQADGRMGVTRGLADFATVYSDQSQVNLNYAEPEVLASLPEIDLDLARLIVGARKSRPFDSGSALSQRIPGMVRGQALSSLST
jgi:general secretion pathway protein K